MSLNIYIDESGDQGWKLNKQHGYGGSSRYYSCAFLVVPLQHAGKTKEIVRMVHEKFRFSLKRELKGSALGVQERRFFLYEVIKLLKKYPSIRIRVVVLQKEKVPLEIRESIFNMLRSQITYLGIRASVQSTNAISIYPDERGSSESQVQFVVNYLLSRLWFDHGYFGSFSYQPKDSKGNENLLFVDWISYICWCHFERENSHGFEVIREHLDFVHVNF